MLLIEQGPRLPLRDRRAMCSIDPRGDHRQSCGVLGPGRTSGPWATMATRGPRAPRHTVGPDSPGRIAPPEWPDSASPGRVIVTNPPSNGGRRFTCSEGAIGVGNPAPKRAGQDLPDSPAIVMSRPRLHVPSTGPRTGPGDASRRVTSTQVRRRPPSPAGRPTVYRRSLRAGSISFWTRRNRIRSTGCFTSTAPPA
jgi:hypothetical protein